ncbi:MAG: hypothetical protein MJ102_04715 [Clostridia bacterium]|nr:hypothetical protein [Clostridia bacterium]
MALALIAVMLLGVCACGNEAKKKDPIIGSWECEYDATDATLDDFENAFGYTPDIDDKFLISMYFELNEDGSFELGVDRKATLKSQDKVIDALLDELVDMYYRQMEAEGYSKEQAEQASVAAYGCGIREYFEQIIEKAQEKNEDNEYVLEGYYRIKDGKIELSEDEDDFDDAIVLKYELKGDKLTIKSISGESDDLEEFMEDKGIELPVKFTR